MAKKSLKRIGQERKACAVLSYFLIGIIWFFVDDTLRNDKMVLFHVKQAIVFLLFGIIVGVVNSVLWIIPFIGTVIVAGLQLLLLILFIIGIVNAINLQEKQLPIIGEYAQHLTF